MKKLLLMLLFIVAILVSCKKEDERPVYPPGTRFNLKNVYLKNIAQMRDGVNVIPVNPFTIDEVWPTGDETSLRYYVCHSANGNEYKMPENNMNIITTAN